MKSHFHMKGRAARLALRKRFKGIRKWPIGLEHQYGCHDVMSIHSMVDHKVTRMVKNGEDKRGLQTMNLNNLGLTFRGAQTVI